LKSKIRMSKDSNYYKYTCCELYDKLPDISLCGIAKINDENNTTRRFGCGVTYILFPSCYYNDFCCCLCLCFGRSDDWLTINNKCDCKLITPIGYVDSENQQCTFANPICYCGETKGWIMPLCYMSKNLCCTSLYWNYNRTETKETRLQVKRRLVTYHYFCCKMPVSPWKNVKKISIPSDPKISKKIFQPLSAPNIQKIELSNSENIHHSPSRKEGEEEV